MSEISIEQAYRKMQAECGIEAGDTVKIVRLPFRDNYPFGRREDVIEYFRSHLGSTLTTQKTIGDEHCFSLGLTYNLPFYCLELVEKAKPELPAGVTFTADGLTVGEVYLSTDTIRRNLGL